MNDIHTFYFRSAGVGLGVSAEEEDGNSKRAWDQQSSRDVEDILETGGKMENLMELELGQILPKHAYHAKASVWNL